MPRPTDSKRTPKPTGTPRRKAISPAPEYPRQKQRGGSGPDQVGQPALRRKQRGGTAPESGT